MCFTIEDKILHWGPWKEWGFAIGSPAWSLAASQNSGEELAGEGRERVEGGPGLTTGWFGGEVGTEGRSAAGLRGAVWCRPRERLLRWGGWHVGD
jgi:hypothetical protein